ncbi:Pentatricopeptide repeat [Cinnamomum micranthum f. kanehirae]|uniref:Pentatricopeptide repeat n=1 Tax=Cinnamomum micranthum f. kanehirae TaxID=337451 RepID=A0A3S3LX62_9MAGN|nr:Pentatricopeptide repeat [Cinnamomum micranthum f. kanehirae]
MVLLDLYPNCFTYTSIIATCANFAFLNCGQQVHGVIIRRGFGWNTPLANALIDIRVTDAYELIEKMPFKADELGGGHEKSLDHLFQPNRGLLFRLLPSPVLFHGSGNEVATRMTTASPAILLLRRI